MAASPEIGLVPCLPVPLMYVFLIVVPRTRTKFDPQNTIATAGTSLFRSPSSDALSMAQRLGNPPLYQTLVSLLTNHISSLVSW
jgi:hypothetical protein